MYNILPPSLTVIDVHEPVGRSAGTSMRSPLLSPTISMHQLEYGGGGADDFGTSKLSPAGTVYVGTPPLDGKEFGEGYLSSRDAVLHGFFFVWAS